MDIYPSGAWFHYTRLFSFCVITNDITRKNCRIMEICPIKYSAFIGLKSVSIGTLHIRSYSAFFWKP